MYFILIFLYFAFGKNGPINILVCLLNLFINYKMQLQNSLSIYTCIMVCIFVLFLSMRWWEALQILSRRETSIGLPEAMTWCGLLRCCWQTKLRRALHCLSFHWPAPFLEAYISTQRSCINRLEYRHTTDRQTDRHWLLEYMI